MQGFYCLVNLGLVLIFILNVYRKKSSSILLRTNMFNSLLFEKHVPSQVLRDFSVENLETIPGTFLPKFLISSIYLELLIIRVVFLHYT